MNIRILFLVGFVLEVVAETGLRFKMSIFTGFSLKNLLLLLLLVAVFTTGNNTNKYERKKRIFFSKGVHKNYLLYLLTIIAASILTYLFGSFPHYDIAHVIIAIKNSIIDPYLVFVIFLLYPVDKDEFEKLIKLLTLIFVVLSAMTIISSIISPGLFFGLDNDVTRPNGPFGEPNQTAAVLSMILLIVMAPLIQSRRFTYIRLISTIILLGCIVVTGSRGGVLAAVLATAYYIYSMRKYIGSSKKVVILLAGIAGIIITWFMLPEHIHELVISRFGIFDTKHIDWKEASAGRTVLWTTALEMWLKSPIYGYGWLGYVMTVGSPTHNSYLEALVSGGPLGLLFYFLVAKNIFTIFNTKKRLSSLDDIIVLKSFKAAVTALFIGIFFVNLFTPWLIVMAMLGLMVGYRYSLVEEMATEKKEEIKIDKRILSRKKVTNITTK